MGLSVKVNVDEMPPPTFDDCDRVKIMNTVDRYYTNKEDSKIIVGTLKKFAFFSIVVSSVALFICVVSLPMIYNYAQHIHATLQEEIDYCKVSLAGSYFE